MNELNVGDTVIFHCPDTARMPSMTYSSIQILKSLDGCKFTIKNKSEVFTDRYIVESIDEPDLDLSQYAMRGNILEKINDEPDREEYLKLIM